jgi:putative membrane protein
MAGPVEIAALRSVKPKHAVAVVLVTSALALALLFFVIYGHGRASEPPAWVAWLPAVNASLNGASAVFLVLAWRAIKTNQPVVHARRVLGALFCSSLFLVSYIVYHAVHGDTKFTGHGIVRPIYFFVLITHIVLSAVVLPLVFTSLFFSLSGRFPQHKKVSRYTMPVWLYVSVTGVLVFVMLRAFA